LFNRLLILTTATLLFAAVAQAATPDEARQQLDKFMKSGEHRYAPSTAAKAQAFLGAAMLAEENKDQAGVDQGVEQTLATLKEAEATAKGFRQMFPELVRLKESTDSTFRAVGNFDPTREPNPRFLQQGAEKALDDTVARYESGDLNSARRSADDAIKRYRATLDAALPTLIDVAGDVFSRAISAGARTYAPQSYEAAKKELLALQEYVDGVKQEAPERPELALKYAERALNISNLVKLWRKDRGSYEGLYLKAENDKLAIAEAIGMTVDRSDPTSDISSEALLAAARSVKEELDREKAGRASDRAVLEEEYKQKLQADIEAQRTALLAEQGEKMSDLKEAFRAKLEKETFEVKRQKQVRELFKKGEVEILANVDGSLLVRLTALRFRPGSKKIDAAYYALLGRLKQALDVYGDRNVLIEGHTDSKGDVKLNQAISLKRAEAVRDFLIAAKVPGGRLKALGYGEVRPIASNDFEKGRAMNRRIDVVIEAKGK